MTVKVIGLIKLKDENAFEIYRSQVGATVARYHGTVITRGTCNHMYWNELPCATFNAYVELDFPTASDADRWAQSPEYQALVPIRGQAMNLTLFRVTT